MFTNNLILGKVGQATILLTRRAGSVTTTSRRLLYSAFVVGQEKVAIAQFMPGANYVSEADEAPTFLEGHDYPLSEIDTEFTAKSYNMVVISGDEGYKRVAQGNITFTGEWDLNYSSTSGQFTFEMTDDTTTYPGSSARQEIDVILRSSRNDVITGRTAGDTIVFSDARSQLIFDQQALEWELIIIVRSVADDYAEVRIATGIDIATAISTGLSGNQAGVTP